MDDATSVMPDGTLVLDVPVKLPSVLDLLVVGGGPAGTALAFRAKELGLSVLVIDQDDVLTRIRDYSKSKSILPDFGGGDKMQFPEAGPLVAQLHFEPIDKDDMARSWKSLFCRNNVPAQIGVELVGLEQRSDGVWHASAWNNRTGSSQSFVAKHVALALGGGMPRRLDIPGDVRTIAGRLSDAAAYVGAPVCVIGGGTSAAEAVIAISQAKSQASDQAPVCWAYRGTKMPAVSKALADALFTAYHEGGNIRYLPASEPVAITSRSRGTVLCVECDRKEMPDRPVEIVQLEFLTRYCVACIGQEIPQKFLGTLGIFPATGGPKNRKAMVVSPLLETVQRNVYLLGDILSPFYLEAKDFEAGPAELCEIKRRGNIKAALRDGVLVAEVVAQKLAGRTDIRVELAGEAPPRPIASPQSILAVEAPRVGIGRAFLTRLLRDGVEAEEFTLNPEKPTTVGREASDISFPTDTLLSDRHATISPGPDGYTIEDHDSRNGVYVRVTETQPTEVPPGSIVNVGNQWLVFGGDRDRLAFTHYDQRGVERRRYGLSQGTTIVLGRDASGIVLDSLDGALSRRHLSVTVKGGIITLRDLKTVNGTYLKVRARRRLNEGDEIRVGSQMLRFTFSREAKPPNKIQFDTSVSIARKSTAAPPGGRVRGIPVGQEPSGLEVLFSNVGKKCAFRKGESLCEAAEANGIKIKAQCHSGICGSDPIRVRSGREHLNAITDGEAGTLEDICGLQPGEYRLACVTRPTGPVVVEVVDA